MSELMITINENAHGMNNYINLDELKTAVLRELERQCAPLIAPGNANFWFEVCTSKLTKNYTVTFDKE